MIVVLPQRRKGTKGKSCAFSAKFLPERLEDGKPTAVNLLTALTFFPVNAVLSAQRKKLCDPLCTSCILCGFNFPVCVPLRTLQTDYCLLRKWKISFTTKARRTPRGKAELLVGFFIGKAGRRGTKYCRLPYRLPVFPVNQFFPHSGILRVPLCAPSSLR
jgi:hypothetical protein